MSYYNNQICIVGYGCVLPDAPDPEKFWKNILKGHCSIRHIPSSRWRKEFYTSPNRDEKDKTYSDLAAVIDENTLNSIRRSFSLEEKEYTRLELITLEAARQALTSQSSDHLRNKKVNITLGCMGPDDDISFHLLSDEEDSLQNYIDQHFSGQREKVKGLVRDFFSDLRGRKNTRAQALLPIHAARLIEERFGFKAERCLVDAACASSLAAVDVSMKKLSSYETDIAITGGMEASLDPSSFVLFSKVGALSTSPCLPLDKRTNGLNQGEGAVVFVMKRLEDALKDNDTIHCILKGCGGSSDGNAAGLFSPTAPGQLRAYQEAYPNGCKPEPDFLECHATGTVVGDTTEMKALEEFLPSGQSIPISSVKSLIGHTKGAAGAAGILKEILTFRNKTIPPSPYFETPILPDLKKTKVNLQPLAASSEKPLQCGVSAFGFGGINYHVAMEEFDQEKQVKAEEKSLEKKIVALGTSYSSLNGLNRDWISEVFRIPEKSLPQIDSQQLAAVTSVSNAFDHARLEISSLREMKVAVISASCLGLKNYYDFDVRLRHFEFLGSLSSLSPGEIDKLIRHKEKFPDVTEDTGTGILNNVIAGRVCNTFNFTGKSFNVDAEFNSFAAALDISRLELNSGTSDMVVLVASDEAWDHSLERIQRKGVRCLVLTTEEAAKELGCGNFLEVEKISYVAAKK